MAATLGDFLEQAADHLGDAVIPGTMTSTTVLTAARHLGRITGIMARYVMPPDRSGQAAAPWAVTAAAARARLAQATASLRRAADLHPVDSPASTHPLPRSLARTAEALSAGADLLATHFTTGPDGELVLRSYWATSLISPPATPPSLASLPTRPAGWHIPAACWPAAATPCRPGTGSCCTPFPPLFPRCGSLPAGPSSPPRCARGSPSAPNASALSPRPWPLTRPGPRRQPQAPGGGPSTPPPQPSTPAS